MRLKKAKNILILVNRSDWFMETFHLIKSNIYKVYELVFDNTVVKPFPSPDYQMIRVEGNYPGYRKALELLPKGNFTPHFCNFFIVNTDKIRFAGELPKKRSIKNWILIQDPRLVKEVPEVREILLKHRYWMRPIRRRIWNKHLIDINFMYLSGNGYRVTMRYFTHNRKNETYSEFMKDIHLTDYFYFPVTGNPNKRKILDKELQIEKKL